jgi:hypothetical protein
MGRFGRPQHRGSAERGPLAHNARVICRDAAFAEAVSASTQQNLLTIDGGSPHAMWRLF